jgi:CelD/BcsL family acetyltransferase involved in cellulose biosynthesis
MQINNLVILHTIEEVRPFAEKWDSLRASELRFIPDFEELEHTLSEAQFVFLAEAQSSKSLCMGCFVEENARSYFALGKRSLGSVSIRQLSLVGSTVLGRLESETWLRFLREIDKLATYDFINLGEIAEDSDLFRAVMASPARYQISSLSQKHNARWTIALPTKFDDYLASLGSKSRRMVRQSIRRFQAGDGCSFTLVSQECQVDDFLSIAEAINQRTYQWDLGQQLRANDITRQEYKRLAKAKKLRCYILRINGEPCAFIRGILVGGVYNYQVPGFLTAYAKWSPGKLLLVLAIKDLIENTDCRVFDFGEGGDDVGYKSKFGNVRRPSRKILISRRFFPRPVLISLAHAILMGTKNIARRVFDTDQSRRRIRRMLGG